MLYSSYLAKDFDVLSIAVSGQKLNNIQISHNLQLKNSREANSLLSNQLLYIESYNQAYQSIKDKHKTMLGFQELMNYSKKLNDQLHNIKVKESQRSLLISGVLIALENKVFSQTYKLYHNPKELAESLVSTIESQLKKADLQKEKIDNLSLAYSFLKIHPSLSVKENILKSIISDIKKNIGFYSK